MRLNLSFVLVVLLVFYVLIPILILFFINNDRKYRIFKNVYLSLFFIVLIIGVFAKIDMNDKVMYIGLDFSSKFFDKVIILTFPKFKLDIFINIFMLIPVGEFIFINKIKDNRKYTPFDALLIGCFIGFIIEFMQFVLPVNRLVQISDIV